MPPACFASKPRPQEPLPPKVPAAAGRRHGSFPLGAPGWRRLDHAGRTGPGALAAATRPAGAQPLTLVQHQFARRSGKAMNGSGDPPRRGRRRSAGGTLDQWMTAGRQLVDGVSGARPGSRSQGRSSSGPPLGSSASSGGFQGLGRWVEDRLDWFMEEEDDWPEPWQERIPEREAAPRSLSSTPPASPSFRAPGRPAQVPQNRPEPPGGAAQPPRRALEAISRRAAPCCRRPRSRGSGHPARATTCRAGSGLNPQTRCSPLPPEAPAPLKPEPSLTLQRPRGL